MFVNWISKSSAKDEALRIEGIWFLANLADGSSACVMEMIKHDAVQYILNMLTPGNNHEASAIYIYNFVLSFISSTM